MIQIHASLGKMNIIISLAFAISLLFSSDSVLADKAIVNLDFHISNVAKSEEKKDHKDLIIKEIPYAEIRSIHQYYRNEVSIDRIIKMDWNIINYQPQKDLFSG